MCLLGGNAAGSSLPDALTRLFPLGGPCQVVPRVCVFGGKAASAYYMAKKIVALVLSIAETINNDKEVGDLLKVRCCLLFAWFCRREQGQQQEAAEAEAEAQAQAHALEALVLLFFLPPADCSRRLLASLPLRRTQVVFLPNYNVTEAELIIPAAELRWVGGWVGGWVASRCWRACCAALLRSPAAPATRSCRSPLNASPCLHCFG